MSQYMDEVAPDFISPHDVNSDGQQPLKHLDTAIALYDFPGTQPSHLPLSIGDTVYVLSKSDTGWWDGVIIYSKGELLRGWFPHNYIRSVNYVQPILNKLKNNKEIDSITAANTAANVLIPSFTNLLQRNLLDFDRSPANSSRKNSGVSFASVEGISVQGPSQSSTSSQPHTQGQTQVHPQAHPASSISNSISSRGHDENITFTPIEDAVKLVDEYSAAKNKQVLWIPRCTGDGEFIFYCEDLNIYCESIIPSSMNNLIDAPQFNFPSKETLEEVSAVASMSDTALALGSRPSSSFNASSRISNASSVNSQSSGVSSTYHNFDQPLFAMNNLFYSHPTDFSQWSEAKDHFNYVLDLSFKALKDNNKQLFSTHFNKLNAIVACIFSGSRLIQKDFRNTKYENSIKRKLKRIATSFSQIYINGLLHLSVMHYSPTTSDNQLFSLDITKLNKSTSNSTNMGASMGTNSLNSAPSSISTIMETSDELNSLENNSQALTLNKDTSSSSYFQQIEFQTYILRHNVNAIIKIFIRLGKGKVVSKFNYDGTDGSEDDGEDRYGVLPQIYPRFLSDELNGGNWCNLFFESSNPVLNAGGEDLKKRNHQKVIIDHHAYRTILGYSNDVIRLSKESLKYLDPNEQMNYYNEVLKNERNTHILRLIYKYLHYASSMIDAMESFDFTIFCSIEMTNSHKNESELYAPLQKESQLKSNLTFAYPVVLEFFDIKQQYHDLIAKIVMSTQSLTLDDPDVFKGLKEDDPLYYDRSILKIPTEKAAILLTDILVEQINEVKGDAISLNPDTLMSGYLSEGIELCDTILSLIQQLIEERETILNYSARVMHDDFNVQLLLSERNNTISTEKTDEGNTYFAGQKKSNDLPWYLEGDEEFDLLMDIKGNIKGGTKEALICHLTHHDLFDSNFNAAFLLTFATMMSLGELINFLINRFNIEAPEGLSYEEYNTWISKKQGPIRLRVLNIMKLLLEKHWCQSYYNETLLKRWLSFVQTPIVQSYSIGRVIVNMLQKVLNGEKVYLEAEPMTAKTKPPAPLFKGFTIKKMKLLDIEYVEFARQLTLKEFKLYSKITKYACLAKVWGKKSGLKEDFDDITAFIKSSNQLTNFVAYMILRKQDVKKRVQLIRYFVQVAEKCRQYNNFSSMTAIISALYSSPIHRLKKTWKIVNADTLSHLQGMNKLMNSSRNFNEYRDVLKFIGSEPSVPFFGVVLSDLTFVFHGNPDNLMSRARMINFAKRSKTCEIVLGIDKYKTVGYNLQEVPDIQKYIDLWFDKCPTIEEQYQLSLNLEPRDSVNQTSTSSNLRNTKSGLTNFSFRT